MRVNILAFGILRDHLSSSTGTLELPAGSTVRDLLERCRALAPGKDAPWSSIAVAVNEEYVPATHPLADGDEVALLPPVSGGKGGGRQMAFVRLVHERIVPHDILPRLQCPEDGAIVIFDGIVRDNSRGRKTRYLEYEAYEAMALKQMQLLAGKAFADFPIRDLAIVHRLGRLEIGESSVLIAVFSAHRAAAFDACRWLIDTLKQTVPIWKKEFFEDGAVWAPGDPFPPELKMQGAKPRKHAAPAKSAPGRGTRSSSSARSKAAKRRQQERAR